VGHRELALTLLGFLGFIVALRWVYPYAPHSDFRFVLPVVLPCAVMIAMSFGWIWRRFGKRWPHLATLPGWAVVAVCFLALKMSIFWA
jgi:hypothetical protein